ncbi:MAG: Na+/H+ antiporter NhaA [Planctomycetota bacterium]
MQNSERSAQRERFLDTETLAGLGLIAAAAVALLIANSPLAEAFDGFFQTHFRIQFGTVGLDKPLLLWVNDGLMAVFFLLVGLELKREFLDGELSRPSQIVLPGVAALAGIAVPALIFWAFTAHDPVARNGWAIPAATDIAFALGVLGLVGPRVPGPLRTFLMTLAVFDDLVAILIIALFYSGDLSITAHLVAAGLTLVLVALNRMRVTRLAPYVLVGVALWVAVLKSGVHATVAGVVLGFTIPLRATDADGFSPLRRLEHLLHPWIAFFILPLFALANAGVGLFGVGTAVLTDGVTLGAACGLLVGKSVGVFTASGLLIKTKLAAMPPGATWGMLAGVAILAGIGFTMSLFIGTLAFESAGRQHDAAVRVGVLSGSIVSAIVGFVVLRRATRVATQD